MLFALPADPPSAPEAAQGGDALSVQELMKDKKEYDAMAKVELDLEDAPFLEEEKAPAPPPEKDAAAADKVTSLDDPGQDDKKKAGVLKKLLRPRIAIPVFALIAVAVGAAVFFLQKEEAAPPPPPRIQTDTTNDAESVAPQPEEPTEFIISFEPFWVEQTDGNGDTRFLIFKFSASTDEEKVKWEADQKTLLLRDAVFYYLRHKNLTFLSDTDNAAVMKRDLLGILNGQLSIGRLDDLHIESYLVK